MCVLFSQHPSACRGYTCSLTITQSGCQLWPKSQNVNVSPYLSVRIHICTCVNLRKQFSRFDGGTYIASNCRLIGIRLDCDLDVCRQEKSFSLCEVYIQMCQRRTELGAPASSMCTVLLPLRSIICCGEITEAE